MTTPHRTAARFLEGALLFALLTHAAAMLGMLLLLPGLPGGGTDSLAERAAYVAAHPWLWRLGWFPWQLAALSDLLLAAALLATPWIPRLPAILTLLATLSAAGPEQTAEWQWTNHGLDLAADAVRTGSFASYQAFETANFQRIAVWAACWYVVAALGWTWCLAAAGTWTRTLTRLSWATWGVLALAALGPVLPAALGPGPVLVAVCNGVGFVLLLAWLTLATEAVLRRCRPDASHGRLAPWRHPTRSWFGVILNALANSRLARAVGAWPPTLAFASDVEDVIYVNYLVKADHLEALVPPGLELQRLGPDGRFALFTFLTYRHGHFGPRLLGPLRRLLPSPVQSNWRLHVREQRTGTVGILFVTTAIDGTLHALAARLLAEGMPMHLLRHGEVRPMPDGEVAVRLDPGEGSAPDCTAVLRPMTDPTWSPPWSDCFASYREFLAYCVPQDRAFSAQPWYGRLTRQEIRLDIPLEVCEPLAGTVESRAAQELVGGITPMCFRVPKVAFRFDREEYDPIPP